MNKKELIDALAEKTGVDKGMVAKVIDSLPELLSSSLENDGRVVIPGIAIATVKDRAERTGRNPKTGEAIVIPARKTVQIKPVKGFGI